MASSAPPYFLMDSEHRGASVVITSYALIVYTVALAAIRFWITNRSIISFSLDDAATIAAIVLSITTYIVYYLAVTPGLGTHQATNAQEPVDETFQYVFSGQLVAILAIWISKLAAVALHYGLELNSRGAMSKCLRLSLLVALVFGPVSLALISTQCPSPAWRSMKTTCPGSGSKQILIAALNIASDVWLAIAPLGLIITLHVPFPRKVRVLLLFLARMLVPCLTAGQIISILNTENSNDKTWERAVQSIWDMIVVFASVLCSTVPRTQSFWGSLQSGGLRIANQSEIELIMGAVPPSRRADSITSSWKHSTIETDRRRDEYV